MSHSYTIKNLDDGTPQIFKVFSATSGEKFYSRVTISDVREGVEVVPLTIIESFLTKTHNFLQKSASSIKYEALDSGDYSAVYPGFPGLERLISVGQDAASWWIYAEENYFQLTDSEQENGEL